MIFFPRATRFFGANWTCAGHFLDGRVREFFLGASMLRSPPWSPVMLARRICCFKITHQPHSEIKWLSINITCGVTDRYHPISLMLKRITKHWWSRHKRLPTQQYIFLLFILKYNKKSIFYFSDFLNESCQSFESAICKCAKKELGQYPTILTSRLVNNPKHTESTNCYSTQVLASYSILRPRVVERPRWERRRKMDQRTKCCLKVLPGSSLFAMHFLSRSRFEPCVTRWQRDNIMENFLCLWSSGERENGHFSTKEYFSSLVLIYGSHYHVHKEAVCESFRLFAL